MPLASVKVRLPHLPNFLSFEDVEGHIDVADVPDDQLREIGNAWTDALLTHALKRRLDREKQCP